MTLSALATVACGGDDDQGPFTITQTLAGEEACARESEPTPELDAVATRLEADGYRVQYAGYSALGYFADAAETDEVCADSALVVRARRLGRFPNVTIRQYSDPATLERAVGDLGDNPKASLTAAEPLVYLYTTPDQRKLDQLVAVAEE